MKINDLAQRFTEMKTRVGGNRERMGYEYSFGMTREEQEHITPPAPHIWRILNELEFSLHLSDENENRYDGIISQAVNYLSDVIANEGAITKSASATAEQMLLPLSVPAKEYKLICAAHAHIDMNWMWSWQETVAVTIATFKTMLNLMDEYPDFCFSQSQASVYKIVEQYAPELMERIKAKIAEGRWEVTATAWVETDKNMPNTESLLRHIKVTRDYLQKTWDIAPESLNLDFSPDTFGHSAQIPEIDSFGGIKYYYHCRGINTPNALYRWRAPSGAELLMYREQYWYNSAITPQIAMGICDIARRQAGFKTGLIVYGVGDHGGGATRRDIESGYEMMKWPVFPTITFGTIRSFFHEAEAVRDILPVVDHELNFIFDGCYSTQSRIKRANRYCEAALCDAAAFTAINSAILGAGGKKVTDAQFDTAWQDVLFTHFHDILTGSCVQDSREYAMGRYSEAAAYANSLENGALAAIAENIDTSGVEGVEDDDILRFSQSEGAGAGYGIPHFSGVPSPERGVGRTRIFHIFNPSPFEREEPVEITVWDWTGDMRRIEMSDTDGKPIEFGLVDGGLMEYWSHKYFRVNVMAKVGALGYTTVVLREGKCSSYPAYLCGDSQQLGYLDRLIIENKYIRAEIDRISGSLCSLVDIGSGRELVRPGKFCGLCVVDTEKNGNSAWVIGAYRDIHPISNIDRVDQFTRGRFEQVIRISARYGSSSVTAEIILREGANSLTYNIEADWSETHQPTIPVLAFIMPHNYDTADYICDIPAGSIIRRAENHDIPSLQYVCAKNGDQLSAALITDSKYGYHCFDGAMVSTLINTAEYPDPYPERGIHHIKVTVAALPPCPKKLEDYATAVNHQMSYIPANRHGGTLAPTHSFFELVSGSAVLSSLDTASDGALTVRLYENCGSDTNVVLRFDRAVKSVSFINLMEHETDGAADISGDTVSFALEKWRISQIKVKF
ncbi:MAG: glycoside hydrolase family 38 C-terminal domain-containing protein [Eubacteriales bacterium]